MIQPIHQARRETTSGNAECGFPMVRTDGWRVQCSRFLRIISSHTRFIVFLYSINPCIFLSLLFCILIGMGRHIRYSASLVVPSTISRSLPTLSHDQKSLRSLAFAHSGWWRWVDGAGLQMTALIIMSSCPSRTKIWTDAARRTSAARCNLYCPKWIRPHLWSFYISQFFSLYLLESTNSGGTGPG